MLIYIIVSWVNNNRHSILKRFFKHNNELIFSVYMKFIRNLINRYQKDIRNLSAKAKLIRLNSIQRNKLLINWCNEYFCTCGWELLLYRCSRSQISSELVMWCSHLSECEMKLRSSSVSVKQQKSLSIMFRTSSSLRSQHGICLPARRPAHLMTRHARSAEEAPPTRALLNGASYFIFLVISRFC